MQIVKQEQEPKNLYPLHHILYLHYLYYLRHLRHLYHLHHPHNFHQLYYIHHLQDSITSTISTTSNYLQCFWILIWDEVFTYYVGICPLKIVVWELSELLYLIFDIPGSSTSKQRETVRTFVNYRKYF